MKVLMVNATKVGGAAVAVGRLETQLIREGLEIRHVTVDNYGKGKIASMIFLMEQLILKMLKVNKNVFYSPALFSIGTNDEIKKFDPDIVHLHWINGGLMRPEDLLKVNKPIVWTMHDMWPFCGAEHHVEDLRYAEGYRVDNRPVSEKGLDINKWVWERKKKVYEQLGDIAFVAPSQWLFKRAKESYLLKNKKVVYIPNGIDLKVFFPLDKNKARDILDLPKDKKILMLGSAFLVGDKNKQHGLVTEIVKQLKDLRNEFILITVGAGENMEITNFMTMLGIQSKHFGFVSDENRLREIYSAADLFMMFSKHENLPTMAIESIACGTPVIAFRIGGLSEIIDNEKNGYLISPFNKVKYKHVLRKFILSNNPFNFVEMINGVKEKYDIERIKNVYKDLYKSMIIED